MLDGCRILVVEDEYLLADDLATELIRRGIDVVGPVASVGEALAVIGTRSDLDGAILDINLRGEPVFPAAEQLQEHAIPFVFTTGYDGAVIPDRFSNVTRFPKPVNTRLIAERIGGFLCPNDEDEDARTPAAASRLPD